MNDQPSTSTGPTPQTQVYEDLARSIEAGADADVVRDLFWDVVVYDLAATCVVLNRRKGSFWIHIHGRGLHIYFGDDGTRALSTTAKGHGQELARWSA